MEFTNINDEDFLIAVKSLSNGEQDFYKWCFNYFYKGDEDYKTFIKNRQEKLKLITEINIQSIINVFKEENISDRGSPPSP